MRIAGRTKALHAVCATMQIPTQNVLIEWAHFSRNFENNSYILWWKHWNWRCQGSEYTHGHLTELTLFHQWFHHLAAAGDVASKPLNYTFILSKKTRKIPDEITKMPLNTPETGSSVRIDSIWMRVWIDYHYCISLLQSEFYDVTATIQCSTIH